MVRCGTFNSMESAGVVVSIAPGFSRWQAASEAESVVSMDSLYAIGFFLDRNRAAPMRNRPERHRGATAPSA
jgi:hypothetical protein